MLKAPTRNTLALTFTGLIFFGFFICGVFGVLDQILVKTLLFSSLSTLAIYIMAIVIKDYNSK
ncbi:MAG: hypothetical protein WA775_15330 [Psychroserpens sp.]|uniref:hypothetical protein n=1 Tax=Psychroserpens sp. TaxID=2020870 RepID=UPI003C8101F8